MTPPEKAPDAAPSPAPPMLWECDNAFAVNKPAGWLVHNSAFAGPKERSVRQVVGQALGRRVYPVHRLDRGTSGVLLFAREREHVSAWQSALESDDAVKVYVALVRGRFEAPQDVDYAVKDAQGVPRDARSRVVPIAVSPVARVSMVALQLFTGRHHQARRHMAHLRHPIVNDARHGDSKFNRTLRAELGLERLALHCLAIRCEPAETTTPTVVTAPFDTALDDAIAHLFPLGTEACDAVNAFVSAPFQDADAAGASTRGH